MREIMSTQNIIDLIKGHADGKNYLEIGVFRGGMLSEVAKVAKTAIGIDNFSQFDNGQNKDAVLGKIQGLDNCKLIEGDCFDSKVKRKVKNKSIDVFFYDGDHTAKATEKAIVEYAPKLKDKAILIIDDWNHNPAMIGTDKALYKLQSEFSFKPIFQKFTFKNASPDWWNGIAVFELTRNK